MASKGGGTGSKKYRSAESGRYVKKEFAEKHPKTTVGETDKKSSKRKK